MWRKSIFLLSLLSLPLSLMARKVIEPELVEEVGDPWFTGPLLTPSSHTIPPGHFNIEPYLFYNNIFGAYSNNWKYHSASTTVSNLNFQSYIQMGLLKRLDLTIVPQCFYNLNGEQNPWAFGDLGMSIGIQLTEGNPKKGIPAIKLTLGENFPLGQFEFLDDDSGGTDAVGGGSYGTTFRLVAGQLYHINKANYLSLRGAFGTTVFTSVKVHGANAYGGDATTSGRLYPGQQFALMGGGEFSVTQNFVLALDVVNVWTLTTTFDGITTVPVGNRESTYQLSFAPAVEWNFNANVGVIGGVWFTATGYNSAAFLNGVLAVNWYI